MLRATVKEILAFATYKRREENSKRFGFPKYGNAETDQIQAENIIKFFEDGIRDEHTYNDYKMFEGLVGEIDDKPALDV